MNHQSNLARSALSCFRATDFKINSAKISKVSWLNVSSWFFAILCKKTNQTNQKKKPVPAVSSVQYLLHGLPQTCVLLLRRFQFFGDLSQLLLLICNQPLGGAQLLPMTIKHLLPLLSLHLHRHRFVNTSTIHLVP